MEIKLYLKKINQEMINLARKLPPERAAACDVYVSWTKSCCVLDFSLERPGERVVLPAKRGWIMRKEDFGGLIWDPRTGAVYQLDEEAYHTLLDLDHGFSEQQVARHLRLPLGTVKAFTSRLRRLVA